ncbi:SNF2-related protein [Dyella sp. KRB-257]|uniref:SNF2-related protein n=1 Tax=Dyella sp. KRB-257 TaxID=3400915 RepID=UPI003C0A8B13
MQRARSYARARHVLRIEHSKSGGGDVLLGAIAGSAHEPYVCGVLLREHRGKLLFNTECTCPVGDLCKHAAAMLIVAMQTEPAQWPSVPIDLSRLADGDYDDDYDYDDDDDEDEDDFSREDGYSSAAPGPLIRHNQALAASPRPESTPRGSAPAPLDAWNHWQSLIAPTAQGPQRADARHQLMILLRASDSGPRPTLLALPAWLRPAKRGKGAMVAPQVLRKDRQLGAVPQPEQGWPPGVADALAALMFEPAHKVAGLPFQPVRQLWQEQALETLLQHYPACFESGRQPLQRGEPLPLHVQWQTLADGSQQLGSGLASEPPALLLRGAGLWYVQPAAARYGRVSGDLRLYEACAHAPLLLPEHSAALAERWRAQPPGDALPPPQVYAPPQRIEARPTAVLALHVSSGHWTGKPISVGHARLDFRYGPLRLALGNDPRPERRLHEGRLLEVIRDGDAERAAIASLHRHGLTSVLHSYSWYLDCPGLLPTDWLLDAGDGRRPPAAPEAWRPAIERLQAGGIEIEYHDGFPHDELLPVDAWHADVTSSGSAWFDVSLGIDVGGERIDLLPILRRVLADPAFPRVAPKRERKTAAYRVQIDETRSVELPLVRLRQLIEPLLEWLEGDGALRLHRSQAPILAALDEHLHWRGGELLRAQTDALGNLRRDAEAPEGFNATLRPYQRKGLAWLDFLGAVGLGGILADDMGLGKTVQVLAHILGEKQRGRLARPALVVAPTSLVGNWQAEAARFAPRLKVLVIHGADRADRYDEIAGSDLVITTYPLLPRDEERLCQAQFSLLVLDEAQAIKNPHSQAAQVVRRIPATRRLAMTGTPLENHLGELWAQFDAVEPGLLGSQRQFTRLYRTPIEKHADADRRQRLNRRIGTLLLRRRKDDVLTDLPAKSEIVHTLELDGDQRALYETLRLAQHERVRQAVKERGLAQSGIIVLDALLKLRQACCDPRLVKLASAKKVKRSAKLDALLDLLDGLLGEGRRVLLFSQFTEMLDLIAAALDKRRVRYQQLTGQTPSRNRTALVKRFQDGDVPVFLISLKAGGVGLNLTAADTVIHYDPWWNPAVEAQATDRAHRIGQDKPVFVYRLICAGTVEEKIQAMQGRKAELARAVLEGGGATRQLRFDERDLEALFAPL